MLCSVVAICAVCAVCAAARVCLAGRLPRPPGWAGSNMARLAVALNPSLRLKQASYQVVVAFAPLHCLQAVLSEAGEACAYPQDSSRMHFSVGCVDRGDGDAVCAVCAVAISMTNFRQTFADIFVWGVQCCAVLCRVVQFAQFALLRSLSIQVYD